MLLLDLFEDVHTARRRIEWIRPHNFDDYEPVWIDVAALDASWRKDDGFYIEPGGEGGIRTRYPDFGEWLQQGLAVQMPEVSINDWRDCATFGNGRHRFSWLRDHGVTALPVLVSDEKAATIRDRFGTSDRSTVLPVR